MMSAQIMGKSTDESAWLEDGGAVARAGSLTQNVQLRPKAGGGRRSMASQKTWISALSRDAGAGARSRDTGQGGSHGEGNVRHGQMAMTDEGIA
jgi:hypothetical protein